MQKCSRCDRTLPDLAYRYFEDSGRLFHRCRECCRNWHLQRKAMRDYRAAAMARSGQRVGDIHLEKPRPKEGQPRRIWQVYDPG